MSFSVGTRQLRRAWRLCILLSVAGVLGGPLGCHLFFDELSGAPTIGCEEGELRCFDNVPVRCNAAYEWEKNTLENGGRACDDSGDEYRVCSDGRCTKIAKVTAGGATTCVRVETNGERGSVWCWGSNEGTQIAEVADLGYGDPALSYELPPKRSTPFQITLPELSDEQLDFKDVAVGGAGGFGHVCVLLNRAENAESAKVYCWGDSSSFQAGPKQAGQDWVTPQPIRIFDSLDVEQLVAGSGRTCAIVKNDSDHVNELWCWGNNEQGQTLPKGAGDFVWEPKWVDLSESGASGAPPKNVTSVALGRDHTCALADGEVLCWGKEAVFRGDNIDWDRGDGISHIPLKELTGLQEIDELAAGGYHSCARMGKSVVCWGDNACGQVGTAPDPACASQCNDTKPVLGSCWSAPAVVETSELSDSVSAGAFHSCLRAESGSVWCWGHNRYGQVLPAAQETTVIPNLSCFAAAGQSPYMAIEQSRVVVWKAKNVALGDFYGCATQNTGELFCWGRNDSGQLGLGEISCGETPDAVQWKDKNPE